MTTESSSTDRLSEDTAPASSGSRPPRSMVSLLLRVVIFAAILFVLIRTVDFRELLRILPTVDPGLLAFTFLAALTDITVVGLKWNILLRAFQVRVPVSRPVIAYYTGRIFTLVAPSTVGVDAYKTYFLAREGAPVVPVVSSIFVERFVGMMSSVAFICLALPFAARRLGLAPVELWAAGGWGVLLLLWVALVWALRAAHRLPAEARIPRVPAPVNRKLKAFLVGLRELRSNGRPVLVYFAVSTLEKVFYGSVVWLSARCVGFDLPYLELISLTPLVSLLERLPISFAALGLREGLFVGLLDLFGVAPTQAVAVALVMRAAEVGLLLFSLAAWFLGGGATLSTAEIRSMQDRLTALRRGT